jgi:hypothetical protein
MVRIHIVVEIITVVDNERLGCDDYHRRYGDEDVGKKGFHG